MSKIQIADDILIKKYVNHKLSQKFNNCYSPDNNNIKYLVIMACHCDSELKLSAIKRNLKYFDFDCIDVVLIMSENLPYNLEIRNHCSTYKNVQYKEVPNESTYDFGKWIYGLKTIDYNNYNFMYINNLAFNDELCIKIEIKLLNEFKGIVLVSNPFQYRKLTFNSKIIKKIKADTNWQKNHIFYFYLL